jgi:phosphoribosylformimino-5-aminoimidazole carboxamide ribotide isomerase
MQIIPVLDLLGSQVVRGVAGQREQYRPLESGLMAGSEQVAVAGAIREQFGLSQFYVADLDAILHRRANLPILRQLCAERLSLLVDAGLRRCEEAVAILEIGVERVVAGLETLEGPRELANLIRAYGVARIVFSLDLRDGKTLAASPDWPGEDPFEIARAVVESGCTQLIVLDIARVGTGHGVPTLALCDKIRVAFPDVTILTGGGVRSVEDLRTLERAGIDGVLIASALHDGSISRSDLAAFSHK